MTVNKDMVNKMLKPLTKPPHEPGNGNAARGVAVGAGIVAAAAVATGAAASPLADYAWAHRPLVISAPTAGDAALARQRALLAGEADALAERDMVVIEIVGDEAWVASGEPRSFAAEALGRHLRLPPGGFAAVLIGKDTGVKLRSNDPVSPTSLFALIDRMPMRRREMSER